MAKAASLNIRIDPDLKKGVEALYSQFGLTVADAVNIFFHKSMMMGGLPFDLLLPKYNCPTEAAIQEANDMISGKIQAPIYNSVAEMNAALDSKGDSEL